MTDLGEEPYKMSLRLCGTKEPRYVFLVELRPAWYHTADSFLRLWMSWRELEDVIREEM